MVPIIFWAKKRKNANAVDIIPEKTWFSEIYTWLSLLVNALLPFVIILTLNIFIIQTVRHRNQNFLVVIMVQKPIMQIKALVITQTILNLMMLS